MAAESLAIGEEGTGAGAGCGRIGTTSAVLGAGVGSGHGSSPLEIRVNLTDGVR